MPQPIVVENFAANTGQFSVIGSGSHGPFNFNITGGQGIFNNNGGVAQQSTVAQDTGNMPVLSNQIFVYAVIGSPSIPSPAPGSYSNICVGIYKNAANQIMFEFGGTPTVGVYGNDFVLFIAGGQHNISAGSVLQSTVPEAIGISFDDNTVGGWRRDAGVWSNIFSADISSLIDLTASGALTGYYAGASLNSDFNTTIAISQLWSGPPDMLDVCDPYWNNVQLLLPMDGTNGSTTFPDLSTNAHTMIAAGGANITTSNPKFGSGSFVGPSVGYLQSPTITASPELDISTGDFTIEMWALPTSTGDFFGVGTFGSTGGISVGLGGGGPQYAPQIWNGSTFTAMTPIGGITLNAWSHIALVRSGSNFYFFQNGVLSSTLSYAGSLQLQTNASVFVGLQSQSSGFVWPGQIDDFRLTVGVARYTANFTPPSRPNSTFACGSPIPATTGLPLGTAITDIVNAGMTVGTITAACSNTVPIGYVISTSPAGGTFQPPGTIVNILISNGLCSPTVFAYGKFAPAAAYKPVLIVDAKGIKPRIYRPKENTTVKPS